MNLTIDISKVQLSRAVRLRIALQNVLIAALVVAMPIFALTGLPTKSGWYGTLRQFGMAFALQLSVSVRNARLDAIETQIGTAPILTIRTGAAPADCATANSGTALATLTLPSDWLAAASAGAKAKSGTWQDTSADNTGTAAHFRIHESTATTCHLQGTVTATGGGGDMTVDSTSFTAGQSFTITSFTLTDGNA